MMYHDKVLAHWDRMRQMAYDTADSLYQGGWRAADREEIMAEYDLTEEETDLICERLEIYEEEERQ
mgnify:FL=1